MKIKDIDNINYLEGKEDAYGEFWDYILELKRSGIIPQDLALLIVRNCESNIENIRKEIGKQLQHMLDERILDMKRRESE